MTAAPARRPVPAGQSAAINARQDQTEHLQRLLAYSHLYKVGQRWRSLRMLGTIALVVATPWIAWRVPTKTDLLAATAAGWLVLGRSLLNWLESRAVGNAVRVQELYDSRLFHLPWNAALAGTEPSNEDIEAAARHITKRDRYLNWYSVDVATVPWPGDVLICQRQSLVWGRRDHRAYSFMLWIFGTLVFVGGVVTAVMLDLKLGEYLVRIFLPTSPALLETTELAIAHWRHADLRDHAEQDVGGLWRGYRADLGAVPVEECRRVQDAMFVLRRGAPRVSGLFYRVRRRQSNEITRAGAAALLRDDPA